MLVMSYFLPVQSRHSIFTRVYITQLVYPERREGGREGGRKGASERASERRGFSW